MTRPFLQTVGDTYLDFKVITCTEIEELGCFFRELVHEPTGALVMHIENDDPESLFCLSFRTLPSNARGTPHILEHVVLCGSDKFPVKDPFFSMTRRSLNTYMNALTGSDFTCYPASSQVEKDFYNLLDVYLDAVFHPQIKQTSFLQEGYRLEFQTPDNPTTPLEFKGIVYNEMKGSISPDSKLWHAALEALFPDLPYAHNSGGDPKEIPDLTYQELVQFHKTYYHPSRCLFFFYGSLPLKNHLDYIEKNALRGADPMPLLPPLPRQKRFSAHKKTSLTYAASAEENLESKTFFSFSWLTCPSIDQSELLALSVLDCVLMDTDASLLKKEILGSGLCTQVDALMDIEMSEVPYILTLKGCKQSDEEKVQSFVFSTLETLSQSPFPKHLIEAAIHQIEFSRKEITGDHGPFGLSLFFRAGLAKQHGCDPQGMLRIHSLFKDLLDKIEDPLYLPGLIKKYFLDNPHQVWITMTPDTELEKKEIEEETKLLKSIENRLSEQQKKEILEQTKELEKIQQQTEDQDIECLPKVGLNDVPILPKDFPLKIDSLHRPFEIFHHECFTNSILYAALMFDMAAIEEEEIPYLRLLLSIQTSLGAANRSYVENLEEVMSYTGGISSSLSLHIQANDHKTLNPSLAIRGKALDRNVEKLFVLMNDILQAPDFTDQRRLQELVQQVYSSLHNRISKNALRYGIQLSMSGYSDSTYFSQQSSGLPYYHFIKKIAEDLPKQIPLLAEKLSMLHSKLFSFHKPHLVLSCDKALYEQVMKLKPERFFSFPEKTFVPWKGGFALSPISSQGRIITSQVAYNVETYSVAPYIHPHAPALSVASQLFENVVLHNKIREIGGAYGAGASYNPMAGTFYFYSYRDPQIRTTFAAFQESIETIAKGKFSDRELEEAKLSMIQHLDSPLSPESQGILAYNWIRDGKSKEMRELHRKRLLDLTAGDIKLAVESELLSDHREGIQITFAGKDLFENKAPDTPLFPI